MRRFAFSLETALRWRLTKLETEEANLRGLLVELADLEQSARDLERSGINQREHVQSGEASPAEREGLADYLHWSAAERTRLLRMAAVAGASESARFITRHPGWFLRFWMPGGYSPDRLLDRAAAVLTAPGSGVAGLHLFTFNQLQQAELWRRAALERTGIDKPLLAG